MKPITQKEYEQLFEKITELVQKLAPGTVVNSDPATGKITIQAQIEKIAAA